LEQVNPEEERLTQIWTQALDELKGQMPRSTFETWLLGSNLVYLDEAKAEVQVRNPNAVAWLEKSLYALIQKSLSQILERQIGLEFSAANPNA